MSFHTFRNFHPTEKDSVLFELSFMSTASLILWVMWINNDQVITVLPTFNNKPNLKLAFIHVLFQETLNYWQWNYNIRRLNVGIGELNKAEQIWWIWFYLDRLN